MFFVVEFSARVKYVFGRGRQNDLCRCFLIIEIFTVPIDHEIRFEICITFSLDINFSKNFGSNQFIKPEKTKDAS